MNKAQEQIRADIMSARRARDTKTVTSLSTVLGEIETLQSRDRSKDIKDSDVFRIIDKSIEALRERINLRGHDADTEIEITLLEAYIPRKLTEEELREIKTKNGFTSPREMMPYLVKNHAGQYDGKLASKVASEK